MSCIGFPGGHSPIHGLDPRARLAAAVLLAMIAAVSASPLVPLAALALGALSAALAGLPGADLWRRLRHLNLFVLLLWLILPWSTPGAPAGAWGGMAFTREGIRLARDISLKANAITLIFTSLVATIPAADLGRALQQLALPSKLVHVFMLTVRYADVIHEEAGRLRNAMRIRAFAPRFSMHTFRTLGYLVGLLLVRSVERAERVLAAMKCRAFEGRFLALGEPRMGRAEAVFAALALAHAAAWVWLEWTA